MEVPQRSDGRSRMLAVCRLAQQPSGLREVLRRLRGSG
ncbi:MAG: hypothetical protein AVDCRST_MAG42-2732 [uncultured Chthoniobacterales bacterium]|uniref:Uncharacterized protein n=1 Tax=uncultured Chthoniobacterales bacterium TaxID=1836801 RepID=A0A6J4INJ2_9BACT|nr:MAG: hypothetical protein AVDCRST_MAG42-2732 [uncultured Chthoniobacterales bacterium]